MACKNTCRLCNRLVISEAVTYTAGTGLVIRIPAGSYNDKEKYCIVVGQAIPDTTVINAPVPTRGITVLTETGYLMIVKTFTDDLSWSVQRQLVNNYFEKRVVKNVVDEIPDIKKYDLKVPINPDWYERNRGRIRRICERKDVTHKTLYHFILKILGEKYDLDEANIIFCREVGHYPKYAIDIVSYFRELGEMADDILDKLDR